MKPARWMAGCLAMCRVALLLGTFVLTGCATYSDSFVAIERNLSARRYDAALQDIEKQADTKTDLVLYLLNKGMVLRMKRDFAGSNQALEAAKTEMERLYAASVSENTLSFLVNDATVSYAGDDYEQVLVHLYMAFNYLELGQPNDARVEALQVDVKLREIGENIPGNKFTEDALSRYLTGMIYEEMGEWSDAMIAYRKAYDAYRKYQVNYGVAMPDMLKHDLLRLAKRQGLMDEYAEYRQEFGIEPQREEGVPEQEGELVFVLNNGLAPVKREKVSGATAPPPSVMMDTASPHRQVAPPVIVNIALPYYESRHNKVLNARVSVSGKQVSTQMMENIDAIARASLDSRMPAITARSIARAVSKVVIQESVDRAGRNRDNDAAELLSFLLVRVAAVATERADTRSWLTLPADVQMARLSLPPGSYSITIELFGEGEQIVATQEYPGVIISNKRKTYLTQHWVSGSETTTRR
ncbi:MAG: hypothetical protein HY935_05290 [Nitrosomonadales bacterium]|nr:hypothetical protein [Nitrosomonadales bacterium]